MAFESANLSGAIREKLLADSTLLSLLGEEGVGEIQNPVFRISESFFDAVRRLPFLGFFESGAEPLIPGIGSWRKSTIIFESASSDLLTCKLIADRIVYLLDVEDEADNPEYIREFFDFSNSNITNASTIFVSREPPEVSQTNQNYWVCPVTAELVWRGRPCTGEETSPSTTSCDFSNDDVDDGLNCPDD